MVFFIPLIPVILGALTLTSTAASIYQGQQEAALNETLQNQEATPTASGNIYWIIGAIVAVIVIVEVFA